MGRRFGGRKVGDCPVTESVSDRLVRLAVLQGPLRVDQERVIEASATSRVRIDSSCNRPRRQPSPGKGDAGMGDRRPPALGRRDLFGFAVATGGRGTPARSRARQTDFAERLDRWARAGRRTRGVPPFRCPIAGSFGPASGPGFRFVEASVARQPRPADERSAVPGFDPRSAGCPEDPSGFSRSPASAFDTGRYHADPRLPRELADARYRFWLEQRARPSDAGDARLRAR